MHFLSSLYALHQHYSSTFGQMFMPVLWDNGRQCSKSEVFLFSHFNYVCLQQDFSEPFRANRYTLWVLFTGVKFTIFSKFIWGQNLFLMGYFSELGFCRGITLTLSPVPAILKDFCLSKYTSAHMNKSSFISPFLHLQQPQASSCFITFRVPSEIWSYLSLSSSLARDSW